MHPIGLDLFLRRKKSDGEAAGDGRHTENRKRKRGRRRREGETDGGGLGGRAHPSTHPPKPTRPHHRFALLSFPCLPAAEPSRPDPGRSSRHRQVTAPHPTPACRRLPGEAAASLTSPGRAFNSPRLRYRLPPSNLAPTRLPAALSFVVEQKKRPPCPGDVIWFCLIRFERSSRKRRTGGIFDSFVRMVGAGS